MDKIEVKILNPEAVAQAEKMMVCAARLTQRGHKIKSMADFMELYEKEYKPTTVQNMTRLPHPTIQKFAAINVVVVGASRRFLAQVTRHQNEVKFMSASLQYSDYSDDAAFAIPYGVIARHEQEVFLATCQEAFSNYGASIEEGLDNDSAGYMSPQALRNVLIISATPYQWKHMISQRVCRRNTDETRIVFLKIWEDLYQLSPCFFSGLTTGPFCQQGPCREGRMSCGEPFHDLATPGEILRLDYPLLFSE
jgi:thymidylate synthase (FAD)